MSNELQQLPKVSAASNTISVFGSIDGFQTGQRMAQALSQSSMVPAAYQNNLPNCMIAMEFAGQCGMSVLAVMQNLNIIQGSPAWSATFLIACINTTGKFSPLRYEREDRGTKKVAQTIWSGDKSNRTSKEVVHNIADFAIRATCIDKRTGDTLTGPWVSMEMAVKEGWTSRAGNKYATMPDIMLTYRAASMFARLYCPEISMGMHTTEEVEYAEYTEISDDVNTPQVVVKKATTTNLNAKIKDTPPPPVVIPSPDEDQVGNYDGSGQDSEDQYDL